MVLIPHPSMVSSVVYSKHLTNLYIFLVIFSIYIVKLKWNFNPLLFCFFIVLYILPFDIRALHPYIKIHPLPYPYPIHLYPAPPLHLSPNTCYAHPAPVQFLSPLPGEEATGSSGRSRLSRRLMAMFTCPSLQSSQSHAAAASASAPIQRRSTTPQRRGSSSGGHQYPVDSSPDPSITGTAPHNTSTSSSKPRKRFSSRKLKRSMSDINIKSNDGKHAASGTGEKYATLERSSGLAGS